jgi:hypothetical protein
MKKYDWNIERMSRQKKMIGVIKDMDRMVSQELMKPIKK